MAGREWRGGRRSDVGVENAVSDGDGGGEVPFAAADTVIGGLSFQLAGDRAGGGRPI